jgi:hypothetical protein
MRPNTFMLDAKNPLRIILILLVDLAAISVPTKVRQPEIRKDSGIKSQVIVEVQAKGMKTKYPDFCKNLCISFSAFF